MKSVESSLLDIFRMQSASAARAVRSTVTCKPCSGCERSLGHPRPLPPAFLQNLKEHFPTTLISSSQEYTVALYNSMYRGNLNNG